MLAERSGGRRPVALVLRLVAETDGRRGRLGILGLAEDVRLILVHRIRSARQPEVGLRGRTHIGHVHVPCNFIPPLRHEALTLAQIKRVVKWKECTTQYVLSGKVHI